MTELPNETRRGHLQQSGDLSEVAFQGRVTEEAITSGLAPGLKRLHLNGWVVHLRQGGKGNWR